MKLLRAVEAAPLRTVRYQDVRHMGTNVWRVLDGLADDGLLTRIAHGVYTAPPPGRDGREWRPGLEAAGLAIASARRGERQAVLMGVGAARFWGAIPRAIGDTVVAVQKAGLHPVRTVVGTVHFATRGLDAMEAVLGETELGPGLVTTPAQTLFDLVMRPGQGGGPEVARDAVAAMAGQVDVADFRGLVAAAPRVNAEVRRVAREMGDAQ
jgi:hypothetical protein